MHAMQLPFLFLADAIKATEPPAARAEIPRRKAARRQHAFIDFRLFVLIDGRRTKMIDVQEALEVRLVQAIAFAVERALPEPRPVDDDRPIREF